MKTVQFSQKYTQLGLCINPKCHTWFKIVEDGLLNTFLCPKCRSVLENANMFKL